MPTDRRTFLQWSALAVAGAACTTTPTATPTPSSTPTGSPSPSPSPTPSPTPTSSEEPSAPRQERWDRIDTGGRTPSARREHTLTGFGDRAYLFGGRDGGDVKGDLWEFNLRRSRWRRIDASGGPSPRFGHNAEIVNGVLVVFGGQRGGDLFNDTYTFDPSSERWRRVRTSGSAPGIRYGAGSIATRRHLFVTHGFNFSGRFDDTLRINPDAPRWRDATPGGARPDPRCLHRCTRLGTEDMLLFGGQKTGTAYLDDTWVLDAGRQRWRRITGRGPSARNLYALESYGERAWLFGGLVGGGADDQTWTFTRADGWSKLDPAGTTPPARGGIEGALVETGDPDGPIQILVFGGTDGSRQLDDTWLLTTSADVGLS